MPVSSKITTADKINRIDDELNHVFRDMSEQPSERIHKRQQLLAERSRLVKKLINEVKK